MFFYFLMERGRCLGIFDSAEQAQAGYEKHWRPIDYPVSWMQMSETLWRPTTWDLYDDVSIERRTFQERPSVPQSFALEV